MGDEGIGCVLAEHLAQDPRLPAMIEVFEAGTDLLGCADRMVGRKQVTLLDAILDPARPGALCIFDGDFSALETSQPGAHQLSVAGSLELLRTAYPELRAIQFRLLAVAVDLVEVRPELSPALAAELPKLIDLVLGELKGGVLRK
jgi:hydrogenase maturation protease